MALSTDHKMIMVPIADIEFGSRFRQDYGNIDDLAYDISKHGLITPIAVGLASAMQFPRETDLPYILLAGGRRFTALRKLGWTHVHARLYDQPLNELDFRSIELSENFYRKDLTYAEDVQLKKKIHDLQIQLHGHKVSTSPDAPGWSQRDTAKLIGKSQATVAADLQLAEAITNFPELELDKCDNKAEAVKRLKNIGKMIITSHAAEAHTAKLSNIDKLFTTLSNSYIVGDCLETMKKIPDATINLVEIDPPYAIDLHKVKKGNECLGYNEVDARIYLDFMTKVLTEARRILRPDGWLILWYAIDPWHKGMIDLLEKFHFKLNEIPGLWIKPNGQTKQPELLLGNAYETFLYARKESGKLAKPGHTNVFQFSPVPHTKKTHPTERPIELTSEILNTFVLPGSTIYIPFLGSGSTLLAAHSCQMQAFGNDLTKEYKEGFIVKLAQTLGYNLEGLDNGQG